MKLVIVASSLVSLIVSERIHSKQASSFLRVRRAGNKDDPTIFNYREDWENFKDFLEARDDVPEDDVDKLELCVSECRKEDYLMWGGSKFSENKEAFDDGDSNVRPFPCAKFEERQSCCKTVPEAVLHPTYDRSKIECDVTEDPNCTGGFTEMFNSCILPECAAGKFGNPKTARCEDCKAGTVSKAEGSKSCESCPANTFSGVGEAACTACNAGEHSSSGAASCTQNQCNCSNGTAASGAACTNHGDDVCASCDAGFHSSGNTCEANVCTCANGDAATGYDCGTHNTAVCTPRGCYGDFIFNNGECVAPECSCANGVEHTDRCMTGREGCDTCNDGYHKVGTSCEENVCACNNGQGATLGACSRHGGNTCASCDSGYELSYGSCSLKRCSCPNGTPATGSACPRSDALKCTGCSDGFEIVGSGCNSIGPDNHDLRLVGGNRNRGRLEVFYRGQWGTICNDDFETIDAQVACKQMGFSDGDLVTAQQTKLLYGSGTGPIWLDNVACTYENLRRGDKLTDCRRGAKHDVSVERPIGNHNCGHVEDIGVKCW